MAAKPSIKGSVINEIIADLQELLAEGKLSKSELEARLRPEDLSVLDQPISPSRWYEVELYTRCSEILRDVLGRGSNVYIRQRGFDKGSKLIKSGLYQQMEYAGRTQLRREMDAKSRFEAYGRDLRLFVTLSGSLLNFSKWGVEIDPDHEDRYRITAREAQDYPDILGFATEGLIDSMASVHGLANIWRFERLEPDVIIFRMLKSL